MLSERPTLHKIAKEFIGRLNLDTNCRGHLKRVFELLGLVEDHVKANNLSFGRLYRRLPLSGNAVEVLRLVRR